MDNTTVTTVLHLLWVFSQLSVLGFGGGKGIIPQMHTDAVTTYQWVSVAAVHRVLYDRQARPRTDDDLCRPDRLRRDPARGR